VAKKHLPQRVPDEAQGLVLLALKDPSLQEEARGWLEEANFAVLEAKAPAEAAALVSKRLDLDVVVTQHGFGEGEVDLAGVLEELPHGLEVVLLGPSDVFVITKVLAAGVSSYLSEPVTEGELLTEVARAVTRGRMEQVALDRRLAHPKAVDFGGIVGSTPRMREVMETLRKVAPTDAPVVILGESGSGKELIAQAIHDNSPRAKRGKFVALRLHATPSGLLESELFGHKKGAFTDARTDRGGKRELADGGTLFLDELGDIPLETQTKLLRVLETREFEPVGANAPVRSDFRLIAATNQDIEALIGEKQFREELWYRLNVVTVRLPALRERRGDVPLLVEHFAREFAGRYGKEFAGVDRDAMAALSRHPWPGNIRELRNVVQNMVVLAESPQLTLADVPRGVRASEPADFAGGEGDASLAGRTMEEIEREAIRETLKMTGGNRKAAAELLQIGERTLYRKIEKYDL
jgi:DNA-binding NtrC family response regulator